MIAELYKATLCSGNRDVFADLSFTVKPGQRVAVVCGCPGDGTLLLQAFLGMDRLKSGWVCLDGEPVFPQFAAYFRRSMAFLPRQHGFGVLTPADVARARCAEKANRGLKYSADEVRRSLERLEVDGSCIDKPFDDMDMAVAQRALMALTFMCDRPVALVDEPTLWQDSHGRSIVAEYIASPRFDKSSVVVATRDDAVLAVCDRVIELN